jgi:hypothetical protein
VTEGETWRTITGIAAGIDRIDVKLSNLEVAVSRLAESISGPATGQVAGGLPEEAGITDARVIAEMVALYRDHPRWAVWLPRPGGEWVAARSAGPQSAGPEMAMIWVRAGTSSELGRRMDQADESLTPG